MANRDILVVSVKGGKPRRLTEDSSDEVRPSWSRGGRWIYFGSKRTGDWQVWKSPAEGGKAVQVPQQGGREALQSFAVNLVSSPKALSFPRSSTLPATRR